MRALLSTLALSAMLCSCAVYTPAGSVIVDPSGYPSSGGSGHCPPGQAKKGNC